MTRENEELLLKDLCARLPYGAMLNIIYNEFTNETFNARISTIDYCGEIKVRYGYEEYEQAYSLEQIKPYLFPFSNMTEEQKKYITDRWGINEHFDFEIDPNWGKYFVKLGDVVSFINWCYENHLDVNGLIPKGLAIDATDKNIY